MAASSTQVSDRVSVRKLGDAQGDLEILARHVSTILGRGLEMKETIQAGTVVPDRDDQGLTHALAILRRLVAVEWQLRLVLVYAYLVTGPEARERSSGFATRIGLVFASASQRLNWLTMPAKSMGMGAATKQGDRLLQLAVDAYANATDFDVANDGRWLSIAIDQVTRMDALASRDIRCLVRVRETNRCAPPPGTPKNRKERRELARTGVEKNARG